MKVLPPHSEISNHWRLPPSGGISPPSGGCSPSGGPVPQWRSPPKWRSPPLEVPPTVEVPPTSGAFPPLMKVSPPWRFHPMEVPSHGGPHPVEVLPPWWRPWCLQRVGPVTGRSRCCFAEPPGRLLGVMRLARVIGGYIGARLGSSWHSLPSSVRHRGASPEASRALPGPSCTKPAVLGSPAHPGGTSIASSPGDIQGRRKCPGGESRRVADQNHGLHRS